MHHYFHSPFHKYNIFSIYKGIIMPSLPFLTDTSTQLSWTFTTSTTALDNYATSNYVSSNYLALTGGAMTGKLNTINHRGANGCKLFIKFT